MGASKTRFHRGLTTVFRQSLQSTGIAIDEELAHRVLAGHEILSSDVVLAPVVENIRTQVLSDTGSHTRFDRMRFWEQQNPGQRPFPPPFAERVRVLAQEARTVADDDGNPSYLLDRIIQLCRAELGDDPYLPDFKE